MADEARRPLIAVDVGNSQIKLGWFPDPPTSTSSEAPREPVGTLPAPARTLTLSTRDPSLEALAAWLGLESQGPAAARWRIASVNRPAASRLIDWLRDREVAPDLVLLASSDLPLEVRLPRPDMVGIDRLLAAVAVNVVRAAQRPAVVVSFGSAITVDLVDAGGAFCGGAILPGIGMAARAMHEFTDLLPHVEVERATAPPPVLGTSTHDALHAGLVWGAIGAVRELAHRYGQELGIEPELFIGGGPAVQVVQPMLQPSRTVQQLVLSGIALVAPAVERPDRPAGTSTPP